MTEDEVGDLLPVGFIHPFKPGTVPQEFQEFDGTVLPKDDFPDLYEAISNLTPTWEQIGGGIREDGLVTPKLSHEDANRLALGVTFEEPIPMVLAIKVRRNVR